MLEHKEPHIVVKDMTLAYGGEIEVRGAPLLVGQAKALNRQKNAINISNIVAADQIGRFPDKNASEATQRIPAVSLLRDQGEGRYVLVRGTEPRLNATTVNGERIPSSEAGIRTIALDTILNNVDLARERSAFLHDVECREHLGVASRCPADQCDVGAALAPDEPEEVAPRSAVAPTSAAQSRLP